MKLKIPDWLKRRVDLSPTGIVPIPRSICYRCLRPHHPATRQRRQTRSDPRRLWRPRPPVIDTVNSLKRSSGGALLRTPGGGLAKECCCDEGEKTCEDCDCGPGCCDCTAIDWRGSIITDLCATCVEEEGVGIRSLIIGIPTFNWSGCLTEVVGGGCNQWEGTYTGNVTTDIDIKIYAGGGCTGGLTGWTPGDLDIILECGNPAWSNFDASVVGYWTLLVFVGGGDPSPIVLFQGCSTAPLCIDGRTPNTIAFSNSSNCRWYATNAEMVAGTGCTLGAGLVYPGSTGTAIVRACC